PLTIRRGLSVGVGALYRLIHCAASVPAPRRPRGPHQPLVAYRPALRRHGHGGRDAGWLRRSGRCPHGSGGRSLRLHRESPSRRRRLREPVRGVADGNRLRFGGATALSVTGADAIVNLATSARLGLARNFAVLISAPPSASLPTLMSQVRSVIGKSGQVVNLVSYGLATASQRPVATNI